MVNATAADSSQSNISRFEKTSNATANLAAFWAKQTLQWLKQQQQGNFSKLITTCVVNNREMLMMNLKHHNCKNAYIRHNHYSYSFGKKRYN